MKKNVQIMFAAFAGLLLLACESQRSTAVTETPSAATNVGMEETTAPAMDEEVIGNSMETPLAAFVSDADFVAKAAQMGMTEVKFGKLAEKMAVDPAVKDFAVEMQEEHTRANSLLMQLARDKKWQTPDEMDASHQEAYNDLMKVMSDQFDRQYMDQMVKDHEMAVGMFQQASGKITDPELKTYVMQTTPALQDHLKMARNVMAQLNTNK